MAARSRSSAAAAREAARDSRTGQFGEQPLADPGVELLAVPEPPQQYLDMIWKALSRDVRMEGECPTSLAELRQRIADDMPGLNQAHTEWFTTRVMQFADSWLRCREVLDLPGYASWASINARIPNGLQTRIPRATFTVGDDTNLSIDPETGRPEGRSFTRKGTNVEWVEALAELCTDEVAGLTRRARAASDAAVPRERITAHPDPWSEYVPNPPF